jgi:hypothetical protein
MNAKSLARHYDSLTAEERFSLIMAAGARGDEAEQERLVNAGKRITLSMPDHSPYGHAFNELVLLIFIELQDLAASYEEAFVRWAEAQDIDDEDEADLDSPEDDQAEQPTGDMWRDTALATGFVLKEKVNGWKLFCERMSIPPVRLWECLPGLDRLQRALRLADELAYLPEGMVRWLNRIRPEGAPEVTLEGILSAEKAADKLEELYHDRVEWWGG